MDKVSIRSTKVPGTESASPAALNRCNRESQTAWTDGRATTVAQAHLSDAIQLAPQVQRQASRSEQINNSPRQLRQRNKLENIGSTPLQKQGIEEEEPLQGQFAAVQRQAVKAEDENRTGMPNQLKAGLEQLSGLDLSAVRVHHNSNKPAQLNALAYAQGKDIHLGPGQEKHLPHEGWHAVQQMQGRVKPTIQAKGVAINDEQSLEHEADVMGAKAFQMQQASNSSESDPIDLLGTGQEKHLPHEAWNVVQQKQGRVMPTMQMKGKVNINDDAGLEKEADAMGAKALQQSLSAEEAKQLKSFNTSSSQVVQAYSIQKDPQLGHLYSVSDDKKVITGMRTPNHELYVSQDGMLPQIKAAAKKSMLDFSIGGTPQLFGQKYGKVIAHFKKLSFQTPAEVENPSLFEKMQGKGSPTTHKVDLHQQYMSKVLPGLKSQAKAKFQAAMTKINQTPWKNDYAKIQSALDNLVNEMELFKKLVIANQATESYHDVVNAMEAPRQFIETVENLIYSKNATKVSLATAEKGLKQLEQSMKLSLGKDKHLMGNLVDVMRSVGTLNHSMPVDTPIDFMLVHSTNYQKAMWKSMQEGTPMFYRACDVMAATVMGNTVDHQNEDQLKIYAAGGNSGAFHYAAKILKSGKDWISLESFAASDREGEILGLNAQNAGKNLDNSWQYIMYGSIRKRGETGGEEDNAFELYTKLRYYLKGIKEPGKFRTNQRDRLHSTIPQNAFVGIGGMNLVASTAIWERLKSSVVFNAQGEVENPDYLEEDYIKLRLPMNQQVRAAAISARLSEIYRTPSSNQRQIQGVGSNELQNIAGWLQHAGLPADQALNFSIKYGAQLAAHPETPPKVHNDALKEMMLALK